MKTVMTATQAEVTPFPHRPESLLLLAAVVAALGLAAEAAEAAELAAVVSSGKQRWLVERFSSVRNLRSSKLH